VATIGDNRDRALMEQVSAGDGSAEHELYALHARAAVGAAIRAGAQVADAEDFVQDAFIRVLAHLRRGNLPTGGFRPYLNAAVRNVAADSHRGRRAREAPCGDRDLLYSDRRHLEPHDEVEIRHAVRHAMATLPPSARTMLWMLDVEGHSVSAVAAEAGVAVEAISSRAYRARKSLRRIVDDGAVPQHAMRLGA
jgi:RNA polymerase sigma factor (sigma-70 family)